MKHKVELSPMLRNAIFVVLMICTAAGLGWLAARHHVQYDITQNANNSLDTVSREILAQMNGPVSVTVYATKHDARLGDIRKIIREFLSLYQRYKPDIELKFIDPSEEEDKARAAGIQLNGEMVIEYAGRSEHLTQINEQVVTSTLLRLAHTREQHVMYLDGHGERKLDGIANFDLGIPFGAKLKENGFHLNSLNLAVAQEVPSNVSVLVITQPQLNLMRGEVDKLLNYLKRGGNLLWLVDAEPLRGLEPLAETLGLLLPPGIVIDPAAVEMNAPATWALGAAYPPHPITNNFNLITAFPSARPLIPIEQPAASSGNDPWQHHALVEVAPRGWISRNKTASRPRFDKKNDTPGPAIIALALQRRINDRDQRVVVVGNGAFLANSYAGNGGNVDLGVNIVNWLSGEEHLITLQPRAARDNNLTLSAMYLNIVGIAFLLGVPLLLASFGAYIWWKRRRA